MTDTIQRTQHQAATPTRSKSSWVWQRLQEDIDSIGVKIMVICGAAVVVSLGFAANAMTNLGGSDCLLGLWDIDVFNTSISCAELFGGTGLAIMVIDGILELIRLSFIAEAGNPDLDSLSLRGIKMCVVLGAMVLFVYVLVHVAHGLDAGLTHDSRTKWAKETGVECDKIDAEVKAYKDTQSRLDKLHKTVVPAAPVN